MAVLSLYINNMATLQHICKSTCECDSIKQSTRVTRHRDSLTLKLQIVTYNSVIDGALPMMPPPHYESMSVKLLVTDAHADVRVCNSLAQNVIIGRAIFIKRT